MKKDLNCIEDWQVRMKEEHILDDRKYVFLVPMTKNKPKAC